MAVKKIPAKTEVTCDACKAVCGKSFNKGLRKMEGRLIIKRHALDMLGDAAADGSCEFDFCDDCLNLITKAINQAVAVIESIAKEDQ